MNEEKYIIELSHPYQPNYTIYVEEAIPHTDGRFINLEFSFGRERAVPLSNRKIIRRVLNKIISVYINQDGIRQQPRPRAIRIA